MLAYDSAGNISGDGTSSYLHDTRGRLILATLAGVQSERHYNGLGQRTYRFHTSAPDFVILSAYDEAGQPIGQYSVNTATGGVNGHEVVYLEGIPVAIAAFDDPPGAGNAQSFGPFYLHPDHLDTPRLVTDTANQVLWRWDHAEPLGTSPANENPSGLGTFSINYRFPGQYLDRASNTHYNYFRDYDPAIGRYIQSDPIGLRGGINTYAYAFNDPIRLFDPEGLEVRLICRPVQGPVGLLFDHCFVYVSCLEEGWQQTFSLQGTYPFITATGYKVKGFPNVKDPTNPDYPKSPANKYNEEIVPSVNAGCRCDYERSVVARFNSAPPTLPYYGFAFNSNNFASYLITSPQFGTQVPSNAPAAAIGLR